MAAKSSGAVKHLHLLKIVWQPNTSICPLLRHFHRRHVRLLQTNTPRCSLRGPHSDVEQREGAAEPLRPSVCSTPTRPKTGGEDTGLSVPACCTVSWSLTRARLRWGALCFLPPLCLFHPSLSDPPFLPPGSWKWSRAVDGLVCCWSSALLICCQTCSRCLSAVLVKAGSWRNVAF